MNLDPEPERATDLDAWRSVAQGDAEDRAEVWVDRRRQSGEPCIYGHRLPTRLIAGLVDDDGHASARDWYPYLTDAQVDAAVWFEATYAKRDALAARCADLQRRLDAVTALADEWRLSGINYHSDPTGRMYGQLRRALAGTDTDGGGE